MLSLATNILSEEYRAAHEDYGDADVYVEIIGAGSECPCNQGNRGSKQSHLYVGHGAYVLTGLNQYFGDTLAFPEVGVGHVPSSGVRVRHPD